jgi:CRISPR-associated protein Cas2
MYVLIVYDIEVGRVGKVHKYLKKYLHWVQNSVFEGELTESQIEKIKLGLRQIIEKEADSVLIYIAREQRWLSKELIGREKADTSNLL